MELIIGSVIYYPAKEAHGIVIAVQGQTYRVHWNDCPITLESRNKIIDHYKLWLL